MEKSKLMRCTQGAPGLQHITEKGGQQRAGAGTPGTRGDRGVHFPTGGFIDHQPWDSAVKTPWKSMQSPGKHPNSWDLWMFTQIHEYQIMDMDP